MIGSYKRQLEDHERNNRIFWRPPRNIEKIDFSKKNAVTQAGVSWKFNQTKIAELISYSLTSIRRKHFVINVVNQMCAKYRALPVTIQNSGWNLFLGLVNPQKRNTLIQKLFTDLSAKSCPAIGQAQSAQKSTGWPAKYLKAVTVNKSFETWVKNSPQERLCELYIKSYKDFSETAL